MDGGMPRCKATGLQDSSIYVCRMPDAGMPGCQDRRSMDSRMPGCQDARIAGWQYICMAGCQDARMPGYRDARMAGYGDSRMPGYLDVEIPVARIAICLDA